MTDGLSQSRAKLSTRLAFVAAGFGVACWAPMVPFAKTRCHLGDDTMGLVLLLLGAGSIVAMPLAANVRVRLSSKPVVFSGGVEWHSYCRSWASYRRRSPLDWRCS